MKTFASLLLVLSLSPLPAFAQQDGSLLDLSNGVRDAIAAGGSSTLLGKMKLPGGVTLNASDKSDFDVSVASANDAGCGMTRVVLVASHDVSESVTAGPAGAERGHGSKARYAAVLPDAAARALANGGGLPPSPFDLDSLAPGASVELEQSTYSALGLSATFRDLTASVKNTTGEATIVSVTRLAGGTVRVTAGPRREVERAESYGVSLGLADAGITARTSVTNGSLVSWDFDVTTAEGANAYLGLITTGHSGNSPSSRQTIQTVSQGSGAYAGAGGVDLHVDLSHGDATTIVTETSDGRKTFELRANVQGAPFQITRSEGALSMTIPLPALSAEDRQDLEAAMGTRLPAGALAISLRGNEWEKFRDLLAARCGRNCNGAAAAKTPEGFALLLSRQIKMGGSSLYEQMALASLDARRPLFAGTIASNAPPACPTAHELSVIDTSDDGANVDRYARTFSVPHQTTVALHSPGVGTRR